jgi:hypothetical protein
VGDVSPREAVVGEGDDHDPRQQRRWWPEEQAQSNQQSSESFADCRRHSPVVMTKVDAEMPERRARLDPLFRSFEQLYASRK